MTGRNDTRARSPRLATRSEVCQAIAGLPRDRTRYIGIDGFGAAGKTSFAKWLADTLADRCGVAMQVVHVDDFAAPAVPEWDWQRLQREVLDPLVAGRPARYERWDYDTDAHAGWAEVRPGRIVLIEGVSATRHELTLPWDLTVWVDATVQTRRRRIVERDGPGRARRWDERWIPEELAYAARERPWDRVDLIVSGEPQPS